MQITKHNRQKSSWLFIELNSINMHFTETIFRLGGLEIRECFLTAFILC